ncbi:GIY-YIG nuclease family protein [Alloscardovia criceti]|uniref:GIY-YIG nuclease family protein n=1 Tax=Alloscardovia criceti TaxID=356828 RepID=UPI001FDFA8F2|nr:GIY-YIG nuclease family protein [Alloscardovia criceti]
MDSDPNGRIKCTLANWTGVAYKIPRTMLDKAREIAYLQQTGVYLLFGVSDDTGDPVVYIGQAGVRKNGQGLLNRWQEHKRSSSKDWWTEAVALTTSNNSFGPTEISYLENRFRNLAITADRYEVMNGNDPTQGNITEEKESELEEFIEYSKLVIGALGYKVFEPLITRKVENARAESDDSETLLYFHTSRAEATGQRTTEGFVVRAGSKPSKELKQSVGKNIRKLREKYSVHIDSDGRLMKDLLFSSPSAAACFVGGSSLSGNVMWKTLEGKTLGELESEK